MLLIGADNIIRSLPAKMASLSLGAKMGFDIFEVVRTARSSRKYFQAPIQSVLQNYV